MTRSVPVFVSLLLISSTLPIEYNQESVRDRIKCHYSNLHHIRLNFGDEALVLATNALMAQKINAGEKSSITKGRTESLLRWLRSQINKYLGLHGDITGGNVREMEIVTVNDW
ncbi:hypothetical protein LOAG_10931 [Loa loa]|uniref:Uncharacterized protein n=1 Tax=Loa loa TaxID=7209 RepID=A0A1S0TNY9_LOALO|nr:hypothetical protein LOAG_10931 [Loa loa]EFO17570.1 hypothetical protein LOAG_10931 [Loa loa]